MIPRDSDLRDRLKCVRFTRNVGIKIDDFKKVLDVFGSDACIMGFYDDLSRNCFVVVLAHPEWEIIHEAQVLPEVVLRVTKDENKKASVEIVTDV